MPRKKQGPRRLDEDAQRAANFVMGEETEDGDTGENAEANRALTARLRDASAGEVENIVREAQGPDPGDGDDGDDPTSRHYTVPAASQNRMYNVIFDDDTESYHSSDDEDFDPVKEKVASPKKKKSPKKKPIFGDTEEPDVDPELEALFEDAAVGFLLVKTAVNLVILCYPIADGCSCSGRCY